MIKHTEVVCFLLVTAFVAQACSDPPSDSGSGASGGTASGGTSSWGTSSGGDSSTTAGGSSSGTGSADPGSGGQGGGGEAGSGGFGGLPAPDGECDVPLDLEIVILGQWVEGEQPAPLGGEVQAGVYDLTAYQRYTTDLPDDTHLGFSTPYSSVVEFGADGTFRAIESDSTFTVAYDGQFSTYGSELMINYDCPEIAADSDRPYTATESTVLFYDGLGMEYVLTRRPD